MSTTLKLPKINEQHTDPNAKMAAALRRFFDAPTADGWVRLEVQATTSDLLRWLRQQPQAQKVYWSDRLDTVEVVGVGVAYLVRHPSWEIVDQSMQQLFDQMHAVISADYPHMRFYGGLRFDPTCADESIWERYGDYHFTLPRFELLKTGDETYFACNFHADESAERILRELNYLRFDDPALDETVPKPLHRVDYPDRKRWNYNINAALDAFERGDAHKVVMARKVTVDADADMEPMQILQMLQKVTPASFHFCYQIDDNQGYIGASPERLYQREGVNVFSDALAGTRKRGATPEEDQALEDDLFYSKKERHEHQLVLDSIVDEFEELCDDVQVAGTTHVLKLAQLQHLYNRVEGRLTEGVGDADIMSLLHPTPAVGGFPREVALRMLRELEPFERGWYAGPVGWVGRDSAEFCVAIRSGLVHGNKLTVYSGAGIVPGSTPEQEWDEIENKLLNFRKALL
ncbi:MAG: isochorismate synthase [Candidatus Promineifilaceae bacterium]